MAHYFKERMTTSDALGKKYDFYKNSKPDSTLKENYG